MARGGYISAEVAVNRVFAHVALLDDAKKIVIDALIAGVIRSRGKRRLPGKRPIGNYQYYEDADETDSDNAQLYDRSNFKPSILDEAEDIPGKFWRGLAKEQSEKWDWTSGIFFNDNFPAEECLYQEITLSEKDINQIVKKHQSLAMTPSSEPTHERLRHSSWDDWVAAVATLAHEHQIESRMQQIDLLDLINARLARWGLHPKENSTVAPTARAVLKRFASNPPAAPLAPAEATKV